MTLDQKLLMWICAWLVMNAALVTATERRLVQTRVRQGLAIPTSTSVDPSTSSPSLGDSNLVSSIVTQPSASENPAPVSVQTPTPTPTPSPTSEKETTMSPTSTTEQSTTQQSSSPTSSSEQSEPSSESSSLSPSPSSINLLQSSETSSATTSSGTSSATPQSSSSPGSTLDFTVHNMTTCTSSLISWTYTGKEAALLLSITNIGVDPSSALSRFKARQSTVNGTIQQQLADTNTSVSSWTWSSVNLTQGWYEIQGLALATPNIGNNSVPFFITNGTNVACLTNASSTATPGASASSSAVATTNVADIAGGVVGAVIGVVLAIIAGIWLWSRKRKRSFAGDGGNNRQKWGSLKSTNSSVPPPGGGTKSTGDRFHDNSESTEGVLEDVAGGKGSATTTPGDSDDDAAIMEKHISPPSSPGMSPSDALNTHIHYDHRTSLYYPIQIPATVGSEAFRSRTTSGHASNQSIEQQAQRIRSSMETPIRRRGEYVSMPTSPPPTISSFPLPPVHTQHIEEYPLSPVTATPANRSISTGSVVVRRGSRKPVPEYAPSAFTEDTNTDSVSTFSGGAESSQTHGTGVGTGASGTPTDLVRKPSLGDGRPVHYLIPDMPLPQRD